MNALEQLLWSFEREDIDGIALTGEKPAEAIVAGELTPIGEGIWTTDALLSALVTMGGSRHVEELSTTPRQWTARVAGLGIVAIAATQRDTEVKALFRLVRRDGKSIPPAAPTEPRGLSRIPPAASSSPPRVPPAQAMTTRLHAQRIITQRFDTQPPPGVEPSPEAIHSAETPLAFRPANLGNGADDSLELGELPDAPSLELELPPLRAPSYPSSSAPTAAPPRNATPLHVVPQVTPAPAISAKAASLPPLMDLPPPPAARPSGAQAVNLATLLAIARKARASDLHIVAGRSALFRIAGELRSSGPVLPPELVEEILLPRVPDRLVTALLEQGSCDFALDEGANGRFRVNVSKQQTGYKACLRLISLELPTVESLRLPEGIASAAHHHQGLIVFTGPTGHGKTTTMNAVVDLINRTSSHHIITVEDPVEHLHPKKSALMSQREVGTHTASFASALKASLREDPDVIVVGELRDVETVRMAVAASETGHLVLGTMNTPSAARTLDRLIDLFPPADQAQVRLTLAAGLRLIVSQRLVPARDVAGMHAAFEVLPGSVPLAALIRDNKTFQIPSLQQRGKALGIVRLDDSLAKLVVEDRVTIETAKAIAEAPGELDAGIKAYRASAR